MAIPRISPEGQVELLDERSMKIEAVDPMTPFDAAFLGRGILACAAALSGANPPQAGTLVADAELPIVKWVVGPSTATGHPVLTLSIPSGIQLTFQLTLNGMSELGAALIAHIQRPSTAGSDRGGTVH